MTNDELGIRNYELKTIR